MLFLVTLFWLMPSSARNVRAAEFPVGLQAGGSLYAPGLNFGLEGGVRCGPALAAGRRPVQLLGTFVKLRGIRRRRFGQMYVRFEQIRPSLKLDLSR